MHYPAMLRMRLVAKRPGLQQSHFEAGILQKLMNLARSVLTIVPRVDFAFGIRLDIGVEEAGVIALKDRGDRPKRSDIGSGEHQIAAVLQNAVDFAHEVHRIFEEMLDELAAEHGREMAVRVRETVLLSVEE